MELMYGIQFRSHIYFNLLFNDYVHVEYLIVQHTTNSISVNLGYQYHYLSGYKYFIQIILNIFEL